MSIFGDILAYIKRHIDGPISREQLNATLEKLARENPEKLNWQQSIVDLLKLVKQPHNLAARQQLALELGYASKRDGSAEMNIWLHERVLSGLADGTIELPKA